jgi:hypothetical protein
VSFEGKLAQPAGHPSRGVSGIMEDVRRCRATLWGEPTRSSQFLPNSRGQFRGPLDDPANFSPMGVLVDRGSLHSCAVLEQLRHIDKNDGPVKNAILVGHGAGVGDERVRRDEQGGHITVILDPRPCVEPRAGMSEDLVAGHPLRQVRMIMELHDQVDPRGSDCLHSRMAEDLKAVVPRPGRAPENGRLGGIEPQSAQDLLATDGSVEQTVQLGHAHEFRPGIILREDSPFDVLAKHVTAGKEQLVKGKVIRVDGEVAERYPMEDLDLHAAMGRLNPSGFIRGDEDVVGPLLVGEAGSDEVAGVNVEFGEQALIHQFPVLRFSPAEEPLASVASGTEMKLDFGIAPQGLIDWMKHREIDAMRSAKKHRGFLEWKPARPPRPAMQEELD